MNAPFKIGDFVWYFNEEAKAHIGGWIDSFDYTNLTAKIRHIGGTVVQIPLFNIKELVKPDTEVSV